MNVIVFSQCSFGLSSVISIQPNVFIKHFVALVLQMRGDCLSYFLVKMPLYCV